MVDSDVVSSGGWSGTSVWVDYDTDGDNDLFVANVFGPPFLYQNDGNGGLKRVTEGPLVTDEGSARPGAAWGDFDNDGDLDALINDSFGEPHYFYINVGHGNFTRRTAGSRVRSSGQAAQRIRS